MKLNCGLIFLMSSRGGRGNEGQRNTIKKKDMKKTKATMIDKVNKMAIKKPQAIELWRETHGHISKICAALGISRTTFYNWMNEDAEFATKLVDAEAELSDEIREVLISKAAEGDMTAVIFYLKNRHPDFKQSNQPAQVAVQVNNIIDQKKINYGI